MASSSEPSGDAAAAETKPKAPAPTKTPSKAKDYSTDPALYIYTSLTAGSSHIVTATSRLETILRANRVPFKAIDIATDPKARMIWGRRAGKDQKGRVRRLPGLVQQGLVLGDLFEIEEWNEYGELKQHVTIYYDEFTQPAKGAIPPKPKYTTKKPAAKPAAPPDAPLLPTKKDLSAAKPAAPPDAPPLPTKKDLAAATASAKKENEAGSSGSGSGSAAKSTAAKAALPIRSIAEEAAQKAKAVRLQSLRDKVYGKDGAKDSRAAGAGKKAQGEGRKGDDDDTTKKPGEAAAATAAAHHPPPPVDTDLAKKTTSHASHASTAGLQSPTTGAWNHGVGGDPAIAFATLQSPTSTSWRPADVDAPVTTFSGARLSTASLDEIKTVEEQEAIKEEPEEEEEEEEENDEEEAREREGEKEQEAKEAKNKGKDKAEA